jgi:hypothetical protein
MNPRHHRFSGFVGALALTLCAGTAAAWDAIGHRAVTFLALDGLAADAPAFLRERERVHGVAWNGAEPDRWRNTKAPPYLAHVSNPDHYIDVEDLAEYGLTLSTIPPLRNRFVAVMAVQRHVHPGGGEGERGNNDEKPPYNPKLDPSGEQEWPGFLPHAIMERHTRLVSMFKTYNTLVRLNDPARAAQLEVTKANIMAEMGALAHFVGDAAQPLHTTKHHHGWVGANPEGYTTDRGIHAYIDGGVLALHGLNYHTLKAGQKYEVKVDARDAWNDVLAYIQRSHDEVETVYKMKKSGELEKEEGKAFISARLHDAAATLAALYNSAWRAGQPTEREVQDFVRYDSFSAKELPWAGEKGEGEEETESKGEGGGARGK